MEYIVLVEGRVVWGPRPWDPFSIELLIERITQTEMVLSADPRIGVVDEQHKISILAVEEVSMPPYDPMFETLAGPEWRHNIPQGTTAATYTVVNDTIPYISGRLKSLAATKRWDKENSGVTVHIDGNDVVFTTDRSTRERLLLQSLYKQDLVWKINDNTRVSLTTEQQTIVLTAINQHVQQSFGWEADICNQIDEATTVESLKQIYTAMQE